MLLVVSDSTPLIYLARIGRFELLRELHDGVLIPPAVWEEVGVAGAELSGGTELRTAIGRGWIRIESPSGRLIIDPGEERDLDPGEQAAIQLALERNALLAIDETHGRSVAAKLGLRMTGTIGLLVRARREGLVPSLRDELTRLKATPFRLSESIFREALQSVGETAD